MTQDTHTDWRHLDVAGLINFRDLGGYTACDAEGKTRCVKTGVLFRSGHFHDVDDEAARRLSGLGIEQVFDFRTGRERQKKPSRFGMNTAPDVVWLELDPGSGATFQAMARDSTQARQPLDAQQMADMMCEVNRSLVTDHADVYRRFFDALLACESGARVIHCASGKDRTGIAAALLLSALGVDRETVLADYLLTNRYLDVQHHVARAMADFGGQYAGVLSESSLTAMYEVRPAYLLAALDSIDSAWGSMDSYLSSAMGLDDEARQVLQQRYLG